MSYRLTAYLEFESEAQAVDAFAQLSARATNTRIVGMGTTRAHTSYTRVEGPAGLISQFFVDTFGIVRQGEYAARAVPAWIQPTGAHDSYPMRNAAGEPTRVEHNGRIWQNSANTLNSWAPGVFGWTDTGPA